MYGALLEMNIEQTVRCLLFQNWSKGHSFCKQYLLDLQFMKTGSPSTDRKNVTGFLYLVLHLTRKVTFYFRLFSSVLVSVLRTSINVLSKSKSRNYIKWIANLTKLFLSVYGMQICFQFYLTFSTATRVVIICKSKV